MVTVLTGQAPLEIGAFEACDRVAVGLRDRNGPPPGQIHEDEGLLRRAHELVVVSPDGAELTRDARPPDLRRPDEHLQQVVEPRRCLVQDTPRPHDEVVLAAVGHEQAQVPVVFDSREVEVGKVAPVVDDSLCVRVREANPRVGREFEGRPPIGRLPKGERSRGRS